MQHTVNVECPVHRSFKVQQVAGMFDLKLDKKSRATYTVDLPGLDEEWQIGVIVGPSGSGKSTVARHAYADDFITGSDWPADQAVIDCFGDCDIRDVTQALTSVGFSSPPRWSDDPFAFGPYCWCLSGVIRLDTPLTLSGKQGLFRPGEDVQSAVRAAVELYFGE